MGIVGKARGGFELIQEMLDCEHPDTPLFQQGDKILAVTTRLAAPVPSNMRYGSAVQHSAPVFLIPGAEVLMIAERRVRKRRKHAVVI